MSNGPTSSSRQRTKLRKLCASQFASERTHSCGLDVCGRTRLKFGIDTLAGLPQSSFTNMGVTLVSGLRALCIAVGLMLVTARAAEPVSPLIGTTRDQVLARYGEPKSQMALGNRVIFLYAKERVVLRDNVVVEVELLAGEPVRRDATGTPETAPPPSVPSQKGNEPAAGVRPGAPAPSTRPASDSKLEIKIVKQPGAKDGLAPGPVTPSVSVPVLTPSPAPAPTPVVPQSSTPETPPRPSNDVSVPVADPAPRAPTNVVEVPKVVAPAEPKKAEEPPMTKKETPLAPAVTNAPMAPAEEPDNLFGSRIFLIAGAVLVGGIALLYWRYRQRQFVLAATSVVNTPLNPVEPPAFTGSGFTADELTKLEWKRFEELVVAYYSKTGVVAARTKTGPDSPVHVKISWKGEPRPFAYVQCIAQPSGLVDAKPLQALVATLEADNIRRGYVVTSGKFNVQARNFAEEKHLTLLSADVFLEKLNALPAAARAEIAQSIGAKDSNAA